MKAIFLFTLLCLSYAGIAQCYVDLGPPTIRVSVENKTVTNDFFSWDSTDIAENQSVTKLRLTGTIQSVPDEGDSVRFDLLFQLGNIQELDIIDTRMDYFPEGITVLACLKRMDLSMNYLKAIPSDFAKLEALVSLNLEDNYFKEVPLSVLQIPNLRELYMEGNSISTIPEIEVGFNIQEMDLSYNDFTEFPTELCKGTRLELLTMTDNRIMKVPDQIEGFGSLKKLNLARNKLRSLPPSFAKLVGLEELNLSENEFSVFPEALTQLDRIKVIYMSDCPLSSIPPSIAKLKDHLERLVIKRTKVKASDYRKLKKLLPDTEISRYR